MCGNFFMFTFSVPMCLLPDGFVHLSFFSVVFIMDQDQNDGGQQGGINIRSSPRLQNKRKPVDRAELLEKRKRLRLPSPLLLNILKPTRMMKSETQILLERAMMMPLLAMTIQRQVMRMRRLLLAMAIRAKLR